MTRYYGWNAEEVEKLRSLAERGLPSAVVAARLGRTVRAVQYQARNQGIRFSEKKKPPDAASDRGSRAEVDKGRC